MAPRPARLRRGLLITLLALACASGGVRAQQSSEADHQAQLQKLKANIQLLQQQLQEVKGSRSELQKELQQSETEIGELQKKTESIKRQIKQQNSQLDALNLERKQLQQAKRDQQQHITQHIRAAHQLGQQGNIKLLLNQDSPERVSRLLKYYDYFLDARADKIDGYLDTITQLNRIEPAIAQKSELLQKNRRSLEQQRQQMHNRQQQRQTALSQLNLAIDNKDQQLQKLEGDRQRLHKILEQLAAALAALPRPGDGFQQLKGRLSQPTEGHIQHRYGSARIAGKLKWNGVLIRAREGVPVHAVHRGRVVFADYLRGHGLLLVIDHGQGYMSLYAHNQSLYRELGDWVEGDETIATVGRSGGQAQAGLYFEIRHQGRALNPDLWLKAG